MRISIWKLLTFSELKYFYGTVVCNLRVCNLKSLKGDCTSFWAEIQNLCFFVVFVCISVYFHVIAAFHELGVSGK